MGDHTAFFYGTLMAREVLYRVCYGTANVSADPWRASLAASLSIQPAILYHYCRHKVRRADYPGIVAEEHHTVRGTYVTGLTEHDISALDLFEGSEYTRRKVHVTVLRPDGLGEGEVVQTETYVFTAGIDYLEKQEWDYEVFRKEKMHRWADHSEEYREVDEGMAAHGHDPTGGRGIRGGDKSQMLDRLRGVEREEEVVPSAV